MVLSRTSPHLCPPSPSSTSYIPILFNGRTLFYILSGGIESEKILQQNLIFISNPFTVVASFLCSISHIGYGIWRYVFGYHCCIHENAVDSSSSSKIRCPESQCSGRTLGMLTGDDKADASWMILSFFKTSDLPGSPEIWTTAFRANAFLFNTRREICKATWQITYNSIHLVKGDCSVSSALPKQDLLVTPSLVFEEYSFQFSTYYKPSLVEYLAPLSPPAWATTEQVYKWGDTSVMPTFTTSVAAMYWSRMTVLFGPDSYVNQDYNATLPA